MSSGKQVRAAVRQHGCTRATGMRTRAWIAAIRAQEGRKRVRCAHAPTLLMMRFFAARQHMRPY
jgi:hypothetical protein